MVSKKYAKADKNQCVACGACIKECPKQAITIWRGCHAVVDESICVGCGKCAGICPTGCMNVVLREETE